MSHTLMIRERSTRSLSILQRVEEAIRSYTIGGIQLKDPALAKFFGSGYESAAGIAVTNENAFTFSAVFDAVNQIASDEAKLPLGLRKRRQDGGSDPFEDSNLYKLLKYEPNRDMSAMVFRRTLMAHALTCHGGYAEIERDGAGRPAALWIITPDRIEPYLEKTRLANGAYRSELRYRLDGNTRTYLEASNVLHIRGLGYDGYQSYSIIDKARQTIGLALAAEKFGATYFGKGTLFGGWLESEDDLDETQKADIASNINAFRSKQDALFRVLVTGRGHTFHQFTNKPSESQMDESRVRQVEEVARFFRMPPFKLGVNTPGTVSYASVEAANLDYYTGCLLDWITLVEQEFSNKLIPKLERGQQFIKHNVNAFLRADTTARSAFYQAMLDRGVFSADDVLELEDRNPQPNGQGKLYLVQGAMIPKDLLAQKIEADIAKTKKETQAPSQSTPAPPPVRTLEIEIIEGRIERAEQAAAEARTEAQREREARVAAEATGTATAAELAALRDSEQRAALLAAQTTALSAQLQAEAAAERQARAEADAARLAEQGARAAETRAREAAEAAATAAEAERVRAQDAAAEAARLAADARRAADAAEARVVEASQEVTVIAADRDAAQGARATLQFEHEQLRASADSLAAARDESQARAIRAEETAATARAELERISVLQIAASASAAQQIADAEAVRDQETAARAAAEAEREALQVRLAGLTAERTQAIELADEQRRQADDLACTAAEARAQLETLTTALSSVHGSHETAVAALRQGIAALERERDDARTALTTLEAAQASRSIELDDVRAAIDTNTAHAAAEAARLREQAADAEARLATETAARSAAEAERSARATELQAQRDAEAEGTAAVIGAHRALITDIMRRMIERESDRALRSQATPEKFRQWIHAFYEGHEDLCVQALVPAIRVHLAWTRSTDEPLAVTKRLIRQHVEDSLSQLSAVVEGHAEALAPSLAALLHRWALDRPSAIADQLMQTEIDHARLKAAAIGPRKPARRIKFDKTKGGEITGASIVEEP